MNTAPPLPPAPPYTPSAEVRAAAAANETMLKTIARSQAARRGVATCDIEIDSDGRVVSVRHRALPPRRRWL